MAKTTSATAAQKPARQPANPAWAADARKKFSLKRKLALLLGVISFAVYANTLGNGFVLDDSSAITKNTIVTRGISALPEIFSTPYRHGFFITANDFYRPLSLALFAAEYQLFEANPLPYHFVNVLLFAGCVVLLFFFLCSLFEEKKLAAAFIASLLFALHPIHTEVAANVKSGDELLCFFFAFLSINLLIRYSESGKVMQLLSGSCCFFLSLLSKETSITFLAIVPIIFFFFRNENKGRSLRITIGIAAAAIAFLSARYAVLFAYHANDTGSILFSDNALAKPGLPAESRIATAVLVLGYYLRLLIVPYPLSCDYSYDAIPFAHFSDPMVLVSLGIYICLIVLAVALFRKNRRSAYAFGILFFLVTLSLFSNIPFLIGAEMGERFLFFGSVGFCIALACLLTAPAELLILKSNWRLWALIAISLSYAAITIARNSDWADNYKLYSTDVKKFPGSMKLNFLLAVELENSIEKHAPAEQPGIIAEAISCLSRSLSAYPEYNDAINNLAEVYFFDKKYEQAVALFRRSIALVPDFVNPYANIGACYGSLGKYDSAIYYLNMAMSIDPTYKATYEVIVPVYKAMGYADSAKKYEAVLLQKAN